jgi:hypothetical protein
MMGAVATCIAPRDAAIIAAALTTCLHLVQGEACSTRKNVA